MKKVLLICSAGMSTSMLVKKMNTYIFSKKLEMEVSALGMGEAKQELEKYDVFLLGPQISYALYEFEGMVNGKPLQVIPSNIYALGNGEAAVNLALEMLGEK